MSGKCLLLLGAGVMQLPAIESARAMGLRTLAVDADPDAPGAAHADRFEPIDIGDCKRLLAFVRSLPMGDAPAGVFTTGTDFSTSVAWLAERLGLPGISWETAHACSDKVLMRSRLAAADLAIPRFAPARPDDLEAARRLNPPVVVKPADSMGARGVRRVDEEGDLQAAVDEALRHSRRGCAIVEEFIPGAEYSADAIVYRGESQICGIAERHICFPPWFVEMGHTMPAELDDDSRRALCRAFRAAIRALGIDNGAAKGDLFLTAGGVVVGEIAARLSGGYMSGWTYPYSSGVDPTAAAIRIAIGEAPGDLSSKQEATSAERAIISIPGRVERLSGFERLGSSHGVRAWFSRVAPGDLVDFPTNNVEKCGTIITAAPDRGRALADVERARHAIVIRLRPGERSTLDFLYGRGGDHYPDALRLQSADNLAALRAMPASLPPGGGATHRAILPLPEPERESYRDWSGRTLTEILTALRLRHRVELRPRGVSHPNNAFGRPFWRALLKGGLQGALFFFDTIEKRPAMLNKWITEWHDDMAS